ncbi:MAG: cadmium-translocating P-type ATPase [Prevotella sp.]|nr:cadmium-translocating P-type ATPase [Staphylococcus sp.]MCM1350279.1 cadmium-translocating P-type ATPase [Prevotella sp.]
MSKNKKLLIRIILALVIFIPTCIVDHIYLEKPNNLLYVIFGCYFLAYLIVAYKVIGKAIKNIAHGKILDENFLMLIASIGAFIIGETAEGAVVMIFYQIGELFENYAVGKSRNSIANLMDIRPDFATKIGENGEEIIVDPSEVAIGSTIIVKVGEKIPLDGMIQKGSTLLNTAALTGESLPKEVTEGMEVTSGMINIGSVIEVQTTKLFEDSTVSKILELVESASCKKAKAENFIAKFARYYTPIVVGLAAIIAIIPPLFTHDWGTWVFKALNFLVVSCPCALVISVPLSFFGGIGGASKKGILIKGSNYFEIIDKANAFVFDKTGTLTKGNFVVQQVSISKNEEDFYQAVYLTESKSNHPIAKCITSYVENRTIVVSADEIEEISGMGIVAKWKENTYLAGNDKLMKSYHISYPVIESVGTIVHFARGNLYLGYIEIMDEIKPDAVETIAYLSSKGYQTIMLTGDNEQVASYVAEQLHLSDYYAGLLPTDKVGCLEEIMNKNKQGTTVYVGDGINDAPVLMRADIGISMGGVGSDSAIEASDVVLMYDTLSSIIDAKRIVKKTMHIVKENIIFALLVKIGILIWSMVAIPNMWLAIFADVGVSVLAICNAMRAMHSKK